MTPHPTRQLAARRFVPLIDPDRQRAHDICLK
jgi:hypothetical protein